MTVELIGCPLCAKIIHRHDATEISSRARVSSWHGKNHAQLLTQMVADSEQAYRERVLAAEEACQRHYETNHRLRLWLWKRLHWNGLMNRRWVFWGSSSGEMFRYGNE